MDIPQKQQSTNTDKCKDKDNATQKSINTQRSIVCSNLYDTAASLGKAEKRYDGASELLNEKKCLFVKTEDNYRRYRNLEMSTATELLITNETMKSNMDTYKKWNTALGAALKDIAKKAKEVKTKFADLKDAAGKLDSAINDSCNCSQYKALTGKSRENCNCGEGGKQVIAACAQSEEILNDLVNMPKALASDIDTIFQSAADVAGIQLFSNLETLEPLEKTLSDQSKLFEAHISQVMKTRKTDLDKLQDDVVKQVQEVSRAITDRHYQRSILEGYYDAARHLCCPPCDCVQVGESNYSPRLKGCSDVICNICDEVKDAFCCKPVTQEEEANC